jgi:TPR repeat protein
VKSGYIRNTEHAVNLIDYAGHKIEAQLLHLEDGTIKTIDPQKYVEYIGTRPGVQLADQSRHGLFTLSGDADMEAEIRRLREHGDCIKWSQIVSFTREDAERTGFDNRRAFQSLIRAKAAEIAKIYNISLNNLVVNAAYHDKDHHPHVHLVFYSTDKREGFVRDMAQASEKLRSLFFNEIFREDVAELKEQKTEQRKELDAALEKSLKRLRSKEYQPPGRLPELLDELAQNLKTLPGRKVYGYLPPEVKQQVDGVLAHALQEDAQLRSLFSLYCDTQEHFIRQYVNDPEKISARMEKFRATLLSPGKSDPKTLQNIILRHAATLAGSPSAEDPETEPVPAETAGPSTVQKEIAAEDGADPPEAFADGAGTEEPAEDGGHAGYSKNAVSDTKRNSGSLWTAAYKEGRAYLYGRGAKQDYARAYTILKAEAETGNPLAAEWFRKSAGQGNQFAEYALGTMYYAGKGVEQDYGEAFRLFKAAAAQGNVFALYELGRMYEKGAGIPADARSADLSYSAAYQGFLSLADKTGDNKILYRLGKMCRAGKGTPADENRAIRYFEESARLGNTFAQYEVAKYWLSKEDAGEKAREALAWMKKAAGEGNGMAQYSLGRLYLDGKHVDRDIPAAIRYLELAAGQKNEFAQYTLGKLYLKGEKIEKDIDKAVCYLQQAADQGNSFALYSLGKLYLKGANIGKDVGRAVDFLQRSADNENEFAQYTLGRLYLAGEDVPMDVARGLALLEASAAQGNDFSQAALGRLYLDGRQVEPDPARALRLLRAAAAVGNENALLTLAKEFLSGEHFPPDTILATQYLRRMVDQGSAAALYTLGKELYTGRHLQRDELQGISLLKQATAKGNTYAANYLQYIHSSPRNSAAYAATLMIRQLAYFIGSSAREDDRLYRGRAGANHLSQARRRFTHRRKQQPQHNYSDGLQY